MITLLNIAQQSWEEVKQAQKAYDNATNDRELGFRKIKTLSSRAYGMLKASGTNPLLLADALNSKRRIWGAPITKLLVMDAGQTEGETLNTRPSYGQGYTVVAEYFDQLVRTIASEPQYAPNERELTLASLQQTVLYLFNLNKAVTDAEVRLDDARSKRNTVCYLATQNLVDTALAVKTYVRSAFGFLSQEHQQVLKIRFTNPYV